MGSHPMSEGEVGWRGVELFVKSISVYDWEASDASWALGSRPIESEMSN